MRVLVPCACLVLAVLAGACTTSEIDGTGSGGEGGSAAAAGGGGTTGTAGSAGSAGSTGCMPGYPVIWCPHVGETGHQEPPWGRVAVRDFFAGF